MSKTSLRVMFMNLENLFSPGVTFYQSSYTQEQYNNKIDWIGTKIAECQPHVVACSELGNDADSCVHDVMQAANAKDMTDGPPFEHFFCAKPSPRGGTQIRNAIMSRFTLSETASLVDYPEGFKIDLENLDVATDDPLRWVTVPSFRFSRPVAKARVTPPNNGTPFNLMVVHLKSKRPSTKKQDDFNEAIGIARASIQRNAEAAALRYYLDDFLPKQFEADDKVPTILVGDFNDTPTSVPIENIRGTFDGDLKPGSPWSEPDKKRLISAARLHMKKDAYEDKLFSYIHNESFALLDQAFVTLHLSGKFKRFEVYNDHVLRHEDLSASTEQEKQWKSLISDHGIIVIEFTRMLK